MSDIQGQRSIPELLGGLVTDISGLFRKELQLAKAEASEKVNQIIGSARNVIIGAVLAIGAVGVLLAAVVSGVAAILVGMGVDPTLANAIAGLIVAVVVGGIAWTMINGGLKAMQASNLIPDRTAHSLARDAEVVKERL